MSSSTAPDPLRLMVASSVYGFETDLDQICGVLDTYGYWVMNSKRGTITPHPGKSNRDNCLDAVRECDVFLGIIRPFYGSGVVGERSITHDEIRLAIDLNKPRWFLVHGHVTFARQLMKQYREFNQGKPWVPDWLLNWLGCTRFAFNKTGVMDDLRVIDIYDDAIRSSQPIQKRTGHWAHEFYTLSQALPFLQTVFGEQDRIRQIVQEMRSI